MKTIIFAALALSMASSIALACPEGAYSVEFLAGQLAGRTGTINVKHFGEDCAMGGRSSWLIAAPIGVKSLNGNFEVGSAGTGSTTVASGGNAIFRSRVVSREAIKIGGVDVDVAKIEIELDLLRGTRDRYEVLYDPTRKLIVGHSLYPGDFGAQPSIWRLTSVTPKSR